MIIMNEDFLKLNINIKYSTSILWFEEIIARKQHPATQSFFLFFFSPTLSQ